MIQRLVLTLQALAAPADQQLTRFRDVVARADELALDYADALLLVTDCPQMRLTAEQQAALERVGDLLEAMRGSEVTAPWTETALREAAEWQAVRRLAGQALRALGQPDVGAARRTEAAHD